MRMIVGCEQRWNQMRSEQKKMLLAILAKMIATGLGDYLHDLQVRWCVSGSTAADFNQNCGIGYGHVFFTSQPLWDAYFIGYRQRRDLTSPFRRFFRSSTGLAQRNHPGFPFGAREKSQGLSLHLSFADPAMLGLGLIEVHIDRHGSLYHHLKNEVFGKGISFNHIWEALLNDGAAGRVLKSMLDCLQPSKRTQINPNDIEDRG
ncbi:MAG: hypothetical protein HY314_01975 [Acidobacteria bacterium]|nr:hypothetical protein [Acidobacteriota bacterium]